MHAVIVYESMFGNTRSIAEAIAEGLGSSVEVRVVRVADADADATILEGADLLVVGGPTHAWGMSKSNTRKGTPNYVRRPGSDLVLEPGANSGPGVREWLDALDQVSVKAAVFDTRFKAPALLTGRASKGIEKKLSSHGLMMVVTPESFLVNKKNHLFPGEIDRARAWGARLTTPGTP